MYNYNFTQTEETSEQQSLKELQEMGYSSWEDFAISYIFGGNQQLYEDNCGESITHHLT